MSKLLILALVAFVYLNFEDRFVTSLSCYSCRSNDAEGCDPSKSKSPVCPDGFPYCIALEAVTKSNKTVYFRSCFKGDCDLERKSEPNVELKKCNACQSDLCNDDEL